MYEEAADDRSTNAKVLQIAILSASQLDAKEGSPFDQRGSSKVRSPSLGKMGHTNPACGKDYDVSFPPTASILGLCITTAVQ